MKHNALPPTLNQNPSRAVLTSCRLSGGYTQTPESFFIEIHQKRYAHEVLVGLRVITYSRKVIKMAKTQFQTKDLEAAAAEAAKRFGHRDNVTGIDYGYRWKDGKQTDEIVVRIHVKEKIAESALETAELLPETISGIPVDIIQATYEVSISTLERTERQTAVESNPADHQNKMNPMFVGISIAHKRSTAGTLGAFVVDEATGKAGILSNWHVMAGASAQIGDEILQPGPYDGGRQGTDVVATLTRMMLDRDGDAAIATLNGRRSWSPIVLGTNQLFASHKSVELGMILTKSGRTTGVTKARVDGVGSYNVAYEGVGTKAISGFKLVPVDAGNPSNIEVSEGGDSGSVWYDANDTKAVGLHFAGETNPLATEEHAVACHLTNVLPRLRVRLATAADMPLIANSENTVDFALEQNIDFHGIVKATGLSYDEFERQSQTIVTCMPNWKNLKNLFPSFGRESTDLTPEIGPFGAALIGFAVGAAARLAGKRKSQSIASMDGSPEFLPVVVTAFVVGAVVGSRAVDGRN